MPVALSLPQIGDNNAIFYIVDVDHTQTYSAGVCGSGWIALSVLPGPYLARGKASMLIIAAFTTSCSISAC